MAAWPYNTAAWQRLRRAKLSTTALCEACAEGGRAVVAVAVDHKVAIKAGGEAFPPLDGLMSLCSTCHSWKTNHEDRPDRARKLGASWRGCGLDGGPIGDDDGWDALADDPPPTALPAPLGGLQGRRSPPTGPAGKSQTELVSLNVKTFIEGIS